jgi:multiple sugar transport system substrate-binding protein
MVEDGIAPQAVSTYKEQECEPLFLGGNAVFCRQWSYMYALASDPEISKVEPEQIGIAPLPVAEEGLRSVSLGGGWNLLVNANSENQDAAYEFIRFATAPEQQKYRALEGTFLPTLTALYDDPEILDAIPVIAAAKDVIPNVETPPVSPYYSDMSLLMAEQFNASLEGEVSPEQAVATLQEELRNIVEQTG